MHLLCSPHSTVEGCAGRVGQPGFRESMFWCLLRASRMASPAETTYAMEVSCTWPPQPSVHADGWCSALGLSYVTNCVQCRVSSPTPIPAPSPKPDTCHPAHEHCILWGRQPPTSFPRLRGQGPVIPRTDKLQFPSRLSLCSQEVLTFRESLQSWVGLWAWPGRGEPGSTTNLEGPTQLPAMHLLLSAPTRSAASSAPHLSGGTQPRRLPASMGSRGAQDSSVSSRASDLLQEAALCPLAGVTQSGESGELFWGSGDEKPSWGQERFQDDLLSGTRVDTLE